tara:strand:+ start:1099 stop:2682 length:1584 start_codon:yes stop_codon:yes gene_type:complete
MKITKQKSLLFFLITFSIYCALNLGLTWDEDFLIYTQGKRTADYLLSLGSINQEIFRGEFYSPIYYTIKYILINIFPLEFRVEVSYLINLFFSFLVILGIKKICAFLFNKDVGKIAFLILFFYPAFFGHMAFNSKDTIVALAHVWILYLLIDYIKKGNDNKKSVNNLYLVSLLAALGSGINLFFLGSLLPVVIIILSDIFIFKKIVNKSFNYKKLSFDVLKSFFLFYAILLLFWIDTHPNLLTFPIKIFSDWAFGDLFRGYPFILFNEDHYIIADTPKSYLILNILLRSPEYFLLSYFIFIIISLSTNYFVKSFKNFYYKLFIVLFLVINPFIILYIAPFSIYDGLRHVLWLLPYLCIIPALTIYYLFKNFNYFLSKFSSVIMLLLIVYFLFNFFRLTPYQYTYLNIFNGNNKNFDKKFENDYWGSSIQELIKKINFDKKTKFTYSVCGVNSGVVKIYLKKEGFINSVMEAENNAQFIFMTNRAIKKDPRGKYHSKNVTNCYIQYKGKNIFQVKRNGVNLSVIRKIN